MTTVSYSHSRAYSGDRPYADVILLGVSGNPNVNFKALVDTGADYLQLPLSAAYSAGLNISKGISKPVHGATGTASMTFITSVDVKVEGKKVTVGVFFDPSSLSSALLGRQALLAAVEAGFNASEWLWQF